VAVVFLGVFVGLNIRTFGRPTYWRTELSCFFTFSWGWPSPVYARVPPVPDQIDGMAHEQFRSMCINGSPSVRAYRLPWTHQTYCLAESLDFPDCPEWGVIQVSATPESDSYIYVLSIIINALFTITALALILFLQIPRRKMAARVE